MSIINIISPEVVKLNLTSSGKSEVIRELIDVLKDAGKITDTESIYEAVLAREEKGSTGLESGIAVPHCKAKEVTSLMVAIGISPGGIDFGAADGTLSKIFFLILASPDESGPHIQALAEIARFTKSTEFCERLVAAGSAEEVVELIQE